MNVTDNSILSRNITMPLSVRIVCKIPPITLCKSMLESDALPMVSSPFGVFYFFYFFSPLLKDFPSPTLHTITVFFPFFENLFFLLLKIKN